MSCVIIINKKNTLIIIVAEKFLDDRAVNNLRLLQEYFDLSYNLLLLIINMITYKYFLHSFIIVRFTYFETFWNVFIILIFYLIIILLLLKIKKVKLAI